MPNSDLIDYIAKLRSTNVSDETIKAELIKNGWQESEIKTALAPASQTIQTILPPPPIPRFSMWISFQYVLLFITLWIWSTSLGGIWHYAINKHISDNVMTSSYGYMRSINTTLLQGYLAAIIISYPFFVILFIALNNQMKLIPGIRNIKTRKFFIYLTLVANFLYMIAQLITTTVGFLGAMSSTRTLPHLLVNLIIPGTICFYLLKAVNEDRRTTL
ncbi:MAG: DUF5671 domain-containing protein [Patescibacteria group bacterium]|nr:DUF5671 domain-containing protein [Patescibacteria group bacterium]